MTIAKVFLYWIAWQSLITGVTGHGPCMFREGEAKYFAASLNKADSGLLRHWIERCEDI